MVFQQSANCCHLVPECPACTAAWLLQSTTISKFSRQRITPEVHTETEQVSSGVRFWPVKTGFLLSYNDWTYPNFIQTDGIA